MFTSKKGTISILLGRIEQLRRFFMQTIRNWNLFNLENVNISSVFSKQTFRGARSIYEVNAGQPQQNDSWPDIGLTN